MDPLEKKEETEESGEKEKSDERKGTKEELKD